MKTVVYYLGEKVEVGSFDPYDEFDPITKSLPDDIASAPEISDGKLERYGNVVVALSSRTRFKCRDNESAIRIMNRARSMS